jgi:proteasome accessory factor B
MLDQPALLRQWTMLRTLGARHQGATLKELAEEAGVSQKTVQRDLELLRQLGFPLVFETSDHNRKHWRLDPARGLIQLHFTVEEAAALYLGRQFLEPLTGTYFFEGARQAFAKIRATLGEAALRHLEKLAAAFYQKTHGWTDYARQSELIDELLRAIEDRRLTVITYQSLRATEPVSYYDVHPYALVWHKQALYLIAWSADHGAISSVEVQQLQFERPADFQAADFLAGSLGIFQGDGPTEQVRVRFSPQVARVVAERVQHVSQRLTKQPDGSLLAEYELSSLEEFSSWVLSFGEHAEVLAPARLREEIVARLQASLASYQAPQASSARPPPAPPRERRPARRSRISPK